MSIREFAVGLSDRYIAASICVNRTATGSRWHINSVDIVIRTPVSNICTISKELKLIDFRLLRRETIFWISRRETKETKNIVKRHIAVHKLRVGEILQGGKSLFSILSKGLRSDIIKKKGRKAPQTRVEKIFFININSSSYGR